MPIFAIFNLNIGIEVYVSRGTLKGGTDMDDLEITATLKTAKSAKGKEYMYISIMLTENVEKKVFLEPAETELIKITYND